VRNPFDEIGSDVSTLLVPAVLLAAIVGTLWIAMSQPDQTATTDNQSPRAQKPSREAPKRSSDAGGRASPAPVMMTPMPAGFRWMDATPVPRARAGFALVVILAVVGALLAMAVAGLVVAAAAAVQGAVA
jgi:hypothetical protein